MRILLIVHGFPPGAAGGTEIYTHDLAAVLATDSSDEVFVLTREACAERPEYAVRVEARGHVQVFSINNTFRGCQSLEESYRNPGFLAAAGPVIDRIAPDVAHVQHLTCLSTELPRALAARGVPVVMTLNDYWLLCHRGQLLDLALQRCGGPGVHGCKACIPASAGVSPSSVRATRALQGLPLPGARLLVGAAKAVAARVGSGSTSQTLSASRLHHMRSLIEHVDLFVAPSQTLAERFAAFGIPADRLVRCDQGIKIATPPRGPARTGGPLRLLFAGSFLPSKAPHLLLEAAAVLPPGTVVVDMAGGGTAYHGDNRYAGRLAPLTRQPFVRLHGHVPHERVRDLLSVADALVVPSVWIENAPFVIKEAFASGVPVVASDLGGMAELVTHGVNGLLFAPDDAGALAGQLRRLQLEPGLLEQLRSGIVPPITIEEDAEQHRRLYRRLSEHRSAGTRSPQASTGTPGRDGRVTAVVLNYRTPDQTWLSVRSLESSFDPPTEIIVVHNDSDSGSGIRPAWSGEMDAGRQSGPDGHEQGRAAPEVHLVRTGRNLGFSGGVNVGIAEGLARGADFLLLVNSDAWLAPDAIGLLLDASARQPETGIFAPLVLSREEPGRIATAGIDYSTASGRMRNRLAGAPAETAPSQPFPVAAVSGCVMLIRRAVLERAGTFDEQYFFSFEDVEFCVRAAGAGFGTMCVPGARAWHQGAGSMGQRSPRRVYFATRNHLRLAAGLEPSPVRRALRGGVIVGLNVAYVLTSPDAPLVAGLAAVARGTSDHLRGRYGADPAAQIADVGLHQGQFLHEVVDLLPLPGDDDREGQRDHEDEEDEHQNKDGGGIRDTEETRCEVQRVAPEREDEQRRRAHDPEDRVLLGEPAPSHQLEDEPQEGSADDRCEDLSDVSHAAGDPRRRGRGPSAGPATYGRTQGRRAPG